MSEFSGIVSTNVGGSRVVFVVPVDSVDSVSIKYKRNDNSKDAP